MDKFKKKIGYFACSYNPNTNNIAHNLKSIWLGKLSVIYDNLILLGDFNAQPEKESIAEFFNLYNLTNAVKQNTSFKTSDKPTCIEFRYLRNRIVRFSQSNFTVPKQHFPKQKPKEIVHQQYN